MNILKKILSIAITFALLITTIPINSFADPYVVMPQYNFSNFAKITSAVFYDSDSTIINIQDLHNNKEVQDNIYKLLDNLNKQYDNLEVYIEGASEVIDYNKLATSITVKDLSAFMDGLYSNDKLSGAEYFGYKNSKLLNPTEQKDIYDTNIQNYSFLLKNREKINSLLLNKYRDIRTLDSYLTTEQRKLIKFYNSYLTGNISTEDFYNRIIKELQNRNISLLKYINTKLYIDVLNANKNINQKNAERQLQSVLVSLKNTITYQQYVDLLKDSKNLTDINVIFAYLSANVNDNDKITKYPDLFRLINLKELSSLINPLDLIDEERQMLEDILMSYSFSKENKEIVFINLFFQIYKKLLMTTISSNEYNYYKNNYERFYTLYTKYLKNNLHDLFTFCRVAEDFNELNLKRNISFINNISTDIKSGEDLSSRFRGKFYNINKIISSLNKSKNIKVIVSGGFHTEGINELLNKNKISYLTLTPNVKKVDSIYEQQYRDSIIKQAEANINAISKQPFLQQTPELIVDDIMVSLNSILDSLKEGKSFEDIQNIINGVIKVNNLEDIISFKLDDEGVATIKVEDKVYTLNYEKGKVSIQNNFSTSLAKNIKTLIRESLKIGSIRSILGLKDKYDGVYNEDNSNQIDEYFLLEHNILFPGFADICLKAIVCDHDPNIEIDEENNSVYKILSKVKGSFVGEEFKNAKITVGSSKALVGAMPDGYGNVEEYGSLLYVVWGTNEKGSYVVEDILISDVLFDFLQSFQEKYLTIFFKNLFIHERLEMLAVSGKSEKFNQYVLKHKLSRTTETFHKYIQSKDFKYFLLEQNLSVDNHKAQKDLLEKLDEIISKLNESKSEYSNIISVASLEEDKESYDEVIVSDFLSIRSGDKDLISKYNEKLVKKIINQIKKEYIVEQKIIDPEFDFYKDLDLDDFVEFVNNFVVVYRESNNYILCENLASDITKTIIEDLGISQEEDKSKTISVSTCKLKKDKDRKIILDDLNGVKEKDVLFVEDIISKQSKTFNEVYKMLIANGANKVQGTVFFDLSKEPEGSNLISDEVYKFIQENPDKLIDIIEKENGNISKYLSYWLIRLYKDKSSEHILKQVSSMDQKFVENIMSCLMDMLKNNNLAKDVKPYEIINLFLFIYFGEKKDISSIKKDDVHALFVKYNLRSKKYALEAKYDDWKESIESLIIYSYILGYDYIDAIGVNNLNQQLENSDITNRERIKNCCSEFNISFMDRKTKLKHVHGISDDVKDVALEIDFQKQKLAEARITFEKKARIIYEKYGISGDRVFYSDTYKEYLYEMDKISGEYRKTVKNIMIDAKNLVVQILASKNMKIDDDLFMIVIGGSLVKGNIMSESEIYYDIVAPDGSISKSINNHFAPLYSSILQQIGLTNYHVLKYSSTNISKTNINTFVDDKEIAPFINYEPLSQKNNKQKMFIDYMNKILEETKTNNESRIKESLRLITRNYSNIATKGKGWLGNSFYIAYNTDRNLEKSFSHRWILMSLEAKLNEVIFDYISTSEMSVVDIPVSVEDQIKFIKNNIYTTDLERSELDAIYDSWRYLSSCRYTKTNNTWTRLSNSEKSAIKNIMIFVNNENIEGPKDLADYDFSIGINKVITTPKGLLATIEEFVYDNSTNKKIFDSGYNKYYHLDTWKGFTDKINEDIFVKAQVVSLLIEIDSPELREKLKSLKVEGLENYLDSIFESLDSIKLIDETFPNYSSIKGERSMQNYWDAVATTVKNPETMFALIAHKLTKAQFAKIEEEDLKNKEKQTKDKEELNKIRKELDICKEKQLLLYAVYLPLSRRFGNADIYEYVRNDSFECSHSPEYLNLLNIIETLYGIPYSKLKEYNGNLKDSLAQYLKEKGIDEKDFIIKNRVKSLYSIYEKLNSSRKKDNDEIKELTEIEKSAMKFILSSNNKLFDEIIEKVNPDNRSVIVINDELKSYLSKDFSDLSVEEQQLLIKFLSEIKNAVFSNYKFVDYIKKNLLETSGQFRDYNGLIDISKAKEFLTKENKVLELWFIEFFESDLKDLVGLHVVVKDDKYKGVVDTVDERTVESSQKEYSALIDFFKHKDKITFEKFDKDSGNKQARLKINAAIKMEKGIPIPVEMCFYEETDYNDETYGLYNQKKISAPHFIYKMGKDYNSYLFEHMFAKELDYGFIDDTAKEKKQMVFVSDGFVPNIDMSINFYKIFDRFKDDITCFVEFEDGMEGGVYIQKLPKDSTVFDLATSKYFSDDINVSVYVDKGDPLTSDVVLDTSKKYKVVKNKNKENFIALPKDESSSFTTRGKLILKRLTETKEKNYISKFIESVGDVSDITEVLNLFLENKDFRKLLDQRELQYSEIADKILADKTLTDISNNKILNDKDLLVSLLKIIFNTFSYYENIIPTAFIRRSIQIANHYNLANMFELFEAVEYGIVDYEQVRSLYNPYILIKTKAKNMDDKIYSALIENKYDIEKVPSNSSVYNLIINKEKYYIKNENLQLDLLALRKIVDVLEKECKEFFKVDVAFDKDDENIEKNKDTVFVIEDFVQPKKAFPLMSLGNNVEQLVQYATMHHSDMVKQILIATGNIANLDETMFDDEQLISELLNEYPILMTQILLGLYSRDSYDEQTLLSQETPYLSQENLEMMKSIIATNLKEQQLLDIKLVVSRTLDLAESKDVYSFSTMSVENGVATLYISEALLKEIDKKSVQEQKYLLEQLAIHETSEYIALIQDSTMDYRTFHEEISKNKGQKYLMDFAKSIVPNILRTKNALDEEVDSLLSSNNISDLDGDNAIALLLGSQTIDAFEKAYKLYKKCKFSKIFISGNTRGSLDILRKLRGENFDRENQKYGKLYGINKNIRDANAINTIRDLLSLDPSIFNTLTKEMLDSVERDSTTLLLLDEKLTTPISKDEILDVVSKDGVSEVALIKYVMLESARQDGMSRKEINELIRKIVFETKASNTPQNIANVFAQEEFNEFIANKKEVNIVLIQTPFSQTRAIATLNKYLHENLTKPNLYGKVFNVTSMNFDITSSDYNFDNIYAITKSLGEWTRLIAYSIKGDIIPMLGSKEGLESIPLEIIKDMLSLLPVLNDTEKANLYKVFSDISKQNENFKSLDTLLPMLEQYVGKGTRYNLISDFIKYLYSDTTERRLLEEQWNDRNIKDTISDLVDQSEFIIEDQIKQTQDILSAA